MVKRVQPSGMGVPICQRVRPHDHDLEVLGRVHHLAHVRVGLHHEQRRVHVLEDHVHLRARVSAGHRLDLAGSDDEVARDAAVLEPDLGHDVVLLESGPERRARAGDPVEHGTQGKQDGPEYRAFHAGLLAVEGITGGRRRGRNRRQALR
jgi:hypothetical protein